jgi:bacteriocin biosynthesis cyclodehydratase domain-containing protein
LVLPSHELRAVNARGLQLIRLSDSRVVIKRGVREIVLSGDRAASILEDVLALADGTRTRDEIVAKLPGAHPSEVEQLLRGLEERGLLDDAPGDGGGAFYANFGSAARDAPDLLRTSSALVVGVNPIARSLIRSLLEIGVGAVALIEHPVLDDEDSSRAWLEELLADEERFSLSPELPEEEQRRQFSLLCPTSALGEAEALLDLNRLALADEVVFLPVWIADLVGYVGPLTHPFETACLRCYRLRIDSNDRRYDVAQAVRAQVATNSDARRAAAVLPPMAGVLGEVAAMEVAKLLGRFAPSDAVGRLIEINLVSFRSTVRRVLKLPRCPDCSEMMRRGGAALMRGPQIPNRE